MVDVEEIVGLLFDDVRHSLNGNRECELLFCSTGENIALEIHSGGGCIYRHEAVGSFDNPSLPRYRSVDEVALVAEALCERFRKSGVDVTYDTCFI